MFDQMPNDKTIKFGLAGDVEPAMSGTVERTTIVPSLYEANEQADRQANESMDEWEDFGLHLNDDECDLIIMY